MSTRRRADFKNDFEWLVHQNRKLNDLANDFQAAFRSSAHISRFVVMPQNDVAFRAYVLFETTNDLERVANSPLQEEMSGFITNELYNLGLTDEKVPTLDLKFHTRDESGQGLRDIFR